VSAAGASSPDGAIVRRASTRPDLLVFEIQSRISKADIEWMSEAVDQAFDAHDEIDMQLVMTNYEGTDVGARFSGEAAAVQIRSLGHVRRYAVVGAPGWASAMIEISGKVTPVETKTFELSEEAQAMAWVNEPRDRA